MLINRIVPKYKSSGTIGIQTLHMYKHLMNYLWKVNYIIYIKKKPNIYRAHNVQNRIPIAQIIANDNFRVGTEMDFKTMQAFPPEFETIVVFTVVNVDKPTALTGF